MRTVQVVDAVQVVAGESVTVAPAVADSVFVPGAATARWQRGALAPVERRRDHSLPAGFWLRLLPVPLFLCATGLAGSTMVHTLYQSLEGARPRVQLRPPAAVISFRPRPAPPPAGAPHPAGVTYSPAPVAAGVQAVQASMGEPVAGASQGAPEAAQTPGGGPVWWPDVRLGEEIQAVVPNGIGRVAVAVRNLRTGASAEVNADAVMPPASLFKLGVLTEAYRRMGRGELSPDQRVQLLWDDYADGAGVLQSHIGEYVTVAELLRLMIGVSDNVAATALMRVLGIDAVNGSFDRLGLIHTHYYPDWRPDTTSAADIEALLTALAMGQLGDPEATDEMRDLLGQDQPQAWIQWALPHSVGVAHKSGQLPGVRNDAAIVYGPGGPYVVVVLTDQLRDEADGEDVIGAVAAAVNAYFASDG